MGLDIAMMLIAEGATVTVCHNMTRSVSMHSRRADVDTETVAKVADWVTPVPGGVGPVTVAILMRNTVLVHQRQLQSIWREVG